MKKIAASIVGFSCLLGAGSARANVWQSINNCFSDFDVGGGRFCALRDPACADGTPSRLKCSSVIMPDPPPVGSNLPPSKGVAVAPDGKVYVLGNDNKIYWQYLGLFAQFPSQPPTACVKKIVVATGGSFSTTAMIAQACGTDTNTYRFYNGAWTTVVAASLDIAGYTYLGIRSFLVMTSQANHPVFLGGNTGTFVMFVNNTNHVYVGAGVGGTTLTRSAQIIGGRYAVIGGVFFTCNGSGGVVPGIIESLTSNNALVGGDPTGCSALQLPTPGYDQLSFPLRKIVEGDGPAKDVLWVLTNQGYLSVLTTDTATQ